MSGNWLCNHLDSCGKRPLTWVQLCPSCGRDAWTHRAHTELSGALRTLSSELQDAHHLRKVVVELQKKTAELEKENSLLKATNSVLVEELGREPSEDMAEMVMERLTAYENKQKLLKAVRESLIEAAGVGFHTMLRKGVDAPWAHPAWMGIKNWDGWRDAVIQWIVDPAMNWIQKEMEGD